MLKILLLSILFIQVSNAMNVTLQLFGKSEVIAGSNNSIVHSICTVDLRYISSDTSNTNLTLDCPTYYVYVNSTSNLNVTSYNGEVLFSGIFNDLEVTSNNSIINATGVYQNLKVDITNEPLNLSGNILGTTNLILANADSNLSIESANLIIDGKNSDLILNNIITNFLLLTSINGDIYSNNSIYKNGKISSTNSKINLLNSITNLNYNIINTRLTGNKVKFIESQANSFKGINSNINMNSTKCVNSMLTPYTTKISSNLKRRVNTQKGKVSLLKQTIISKKKKFVLCNILTFNLLNGIAKINS